jgi:hypothetical protein
LLAERFVFGAFVERQADWEAKVNMGVRIRAGRIARIADPR